MESALGWIGAIFEWIGQFVPRFVIVRTTHGAVKFRNRLRFPGWRFWKIGFVMQAESKGPGLHAFFPFTSEFVPFPTALQTDNLTPQCIMTSDGKPFALGGMIRYEIVDLLALISGTYEPVETIRDITLTAIHEVCCQKDSANLPLAQREGRLDMEMRRRVQQHLKPLGIKVHKVMLTDLTPCKVFKLIQSNSIDGMH